MVAPNHNEFILDTETAPLTLENHSSFEIAIVVVLKLLSLQFALLPKRVGWVGRGFSLSSQEPVIDQYISLSHTFKEFRMMGA